MFNILNRSLTTWDGLEQESQKRTKKKICSMVDCWYTAKLTRSRAVKQDWFVRWNTGNRHWQNNKIILQALRRHKR